MLMITGYKLTVRRGRLAGKVREYKAGQRSKASAYANKLDQEYGAICCTVAPIFGAGDFLHPKPEVALGAYRTSPAAIAAEHEAEVAFLTGQGFAKASKQAAP